MCFNASYTKREQELSNILGIDEDLIPDLPVYYQASGFSHPVWPLLCMDHTQKIVLGQWGLIPSWTRTDEQKKKLRNSTLNARGETLQDKPSFRDSFHNKRCIVPVDGFFEPYHHKNKSYPCYCFHPRKELLYLAGLFSETSEGRTFSIITVPAKGLMTKVHNHKLRMPGIIKEDMVNIWLDPNSQRDALKSVLEETVYEELQAHTVSPLIYKKKENSNIPEVRDPYTYPDFRDIPNGQEPWGNH